MLPAAKETQGIIDLKVMGHPQAFPDVPESVNHRLTGFGWSWIYATTHRGRINHIEAVETHRAFQITWPHQIGLMRLVGS